MQTSSSLYQSTCMSLHDEAGWTGHTFPYDNNDDYHPDLLSMLHATCICLYTEIDHYVVITITPNVDVVYGVIVNKRNTWLVKMVSPMLLPSLLPPSENVRIIKKIIKEAIKNKQYEPKLMLHCRQVTRKLHHLTNSSESIAVELSQILGSSSTHTAVTMNLDFVLVKKGT